MDTNEGWQTQNKGAKLSNRPVRFEFRINFRYDFLLLHAAATPPRITPVQSAFNICEQLDFVRSKAAMDFP
jgi:hypothetical protein